MLVFSYAEPAVVNISDDKVIIFGGRSYQFGEDMTVFDHKTTVIKRLKQAKINVNH